MRGWISTVFLVDCVSAWCRRKSDVVLVRVASDGRSIFIDDQSSGVPTTVLLQSVQTDDSSTGASDLPMILKSVPVFANPERAVSTVYVSFEFASLHFLSGYCIFVICQFHAQIIDSLGK